MAARHLGSPVFCNALPLAGIVLLISILDLAHADDTRAPAGHSVPSGLLVVINSWPTTQLDLRGLDNPYMSGVNLQIRWNDIEPVQGKPDWSSLDALFGAAQRNHKWVYLSIYAGFFTPQWAMDGVQSDTFTVPYGPLSGKVLPLPMPWDRVYLDRWFDFLRLVSDRYGKSPAFKMISADGPTSVSTEASLPNAPQELRQWQKDSYTPAKYLAAWRQVFQAYSSIFPNQYISLTMGLWVNINDQGRIDPRQRKRIRQAVVDLAMQMLPNRMALEMNDVHAGQGPRTGNSDAEDQYIIGYNGRVITGFQMKTSAKLSSKGMGAEGDPPLALRRSIDFALEPNGAGKRVNYVEIYSRDVLDDEMQPDLKYAASLIQR